MLGGCETPRGRLSGPRRRCRRSPGRVFSRRGGGGCGCDALSWLRFVMVPETPRPPQLTLRDYHMTEAEGLRAAAAASLAEAGARRRGASPPPPPPSRFGRPHPPHSPPARSTQPPPSGAGSAGCLLGRAQPRVRSPLPHPTRVATLDRGALDPTFPLLSCIFSLPSPLSLFPPTSSDSLSLYYLSPRLASHSGPSSENRDLKACSLQKIPVPGGMEGKTHGEESQGQLPQMLTSSQLYCAPTVYRARGWRQVQLSALQDRGVERELTVTRKLLYTFIGTEDWWMEAPPLFSRAGGWDRVRHFPGVVTSELGPEGGVAITEIPSPGCAGTKSLPFLAHRGKGGD